MKKLSPKITVTAIPLKAPKLTPLGKSLSTGKSTPAPAAALKALGKLLKTKKMK